MSKEVKKITESIEELAAAGKTDISKVQDECKEMRDTLKAVAEIKEQIRTLSETVQAIQTNTAPPAPPKAEEEAAKDLPEEKKKEPEEVS